MSESLSSSPEIKKWLDKEFEEIKSINELSPVLNSEIIDTAHFQKKLKPEIKDQFKDSLWISDSKDDEEHYRQTFGIEDGNFPK